MGDGQAAAMRPSTQIPPNGGAFRSSPVLLLCPPCACTGKGLRVQIPDAPDSEWHALNVASPGISALSLKLKLDLKLIVDFAGRRCPVLSPLFESTIAVPLLLPDTVARQNQSVHCPHLTSADCVIPLSNRLAVTAHLLTVHDPDLQVHV